MFGKFFVEPPEPLLVLAILISYVGDIGDDFRKIAYFGFK